MSEINDIWEKRFHRERAARKEAEKLLEDKSLELYNVNRVLEKKVEEEIDKNKLQEELLFEQSKMATLGEMLESIAHQWRQPLSVITTVASGMKMQKEFGLLTDETFIESTEGILNAAKHLSQTINDFRDFFKADKRIMLFELKESYYKAKNLLSSKFKNRDIHLIENIGNAHIEGYPNEVVQVFMNMLNNSKDVLEELKEGEKKLIFVDIYQDGKNGIVKVKDSGGGIDESIIERVFESHFTTKRDRDGTGIGLYMSKQIIMEHLNGKIKVQNSEYEYEGVKYRGAEFIVEIPLD